MSICKVVDKDWFFTKGKTIEDLVNGVKASYQRNYGDFPFDREKFFNSISSDNTFWRFLYDEKKDAIVGFLTVRALEIIVYERFIQGTIKPEDLKVNEFPPIRGDANLTIGDFVIDPEYRFLNFKRMLVVLFEFFAESLQKDLVIKSILVRTMSKEGETLCKGLHFQKITDHYERGKIYSFNPEQHFEKPPRVCAALVEAIHEAQAKRIAASLKNLGPEKGVDVVKSALAEWGYKVDGI